MENTKKLHLVESCTFPNNTYRNVTKDSKFQGLVESAKNIHAGKSQLNEASIINKVKKTLNESKIDSKMQEEILKNLKEAGANVDDVEIWQFPISKINDTQHPNLNGRVYNKQLWENVVDKQADIWKGGTGLANHPADDEDGDFMNQSIVWLDGFIGDDGIVYGIGTFVGEGGALARQIINVGGRIGFSTSGYGDFLRDGITVDPDTYEIERFADLVLNPSQGVYGDHADKIVKDNKITNENVKAKTNGLKENVNNMNKIKEDLNIKDVLDALKAPDAVEKLSDLADANGIKINLQEGETSDDLKFKLAAECIAIVLSEITDSEKVTVDVVNDVKDFLEQFKAIDGVEDRFKEIAKSKSVSEDVLNKIFEEDSGEEKVQESEEEKTEEDSKEETEDSKDKDEDEDEELDECGDMSLEEQLLVQHYTKQLKNIKKESNEYWEEKIEKLNKLSNKLKDSNLSDKVASKLNEQTQSLVNYIMNDARKAIQEGFRAREICKELEIPTISRLSNIKEKLEDFVSLEECLDKTTKEANKYKALYEDKQNYAIQEATNAFDMEENNKKLNKEILSLKAKNLKTQLKNENLNKALSSTKNLKEDSNERMVRLVKVNRKLMTEKRELEEKYNKLQSVLGTYKENLRRAQTLIESYKDKVMNLSRSLRESKSKVAYLDTTSRKISKNNALLNKKLDTIHSENMKKNIQENFQKAKAKKIQNIKNQEFLNENTMFKDTDSIDNFLNSVNVQDKNKYKNVKTLHEAEDKFLYDNELLSDQAELERSKIRSPEDIPSSLAEMFK